MLVGYFNRKVVCSCCNSSDHSGGCGWIPPSLNFSPVVFVHFDLRGAANLIHHPCIAMWGELTSSITGKYAPSQKRTTTTTHRRRGAREWNPTLLSVRSWRRRRSKTPLSYPSVYQIIILSLVLFFSPPPSCWRGCF